MITAAPAPIVHTGANPISIDLQKTLQQSSVRWCEVLLQNLSAVALRIEIAGDSHNLAPGQANVFPMRDSKMVRVIPLVTPANAPGAVPSDTYQLLLSAATQDTPHPGVYPAQVYLSDSTYMGTLVMPTNVSPSILNVARPRGVNFVRVNVFAGDVLTLTLTGDQTGTTYLSISEPGAGSWFSGATGCQITEASDTSLTLNAQVSASHNCSIRLSGYASEDAAPVISRAQIAPVQLLTAASLAAQATVSGVPDTSAFAPGSSVQVRTAAGTFTQVGVVSSRTFNTVVLTANLGQALAIGDSITLLPTRGPIGVSSRPRQVDFQGNTVPGAGLQAVLTFAAVVGMVNVITMANGHETATVAAADGATFAINSGATIHYQEITGVQAAIGATDRAGGQPFAVPAIAANTAIAISFRTQPQNANNQQSVAGAGYTVAAEPT